MRAIFAVLAFCVCFIGQQASAQELREGALLFGGGGISCGTYLDARSRNNPVDRMGLVQYWFGFATAYNIYSKSPMYSAQLDGSTVLAYLDKFCRDNPLQAPIDGMTRLLKSNGR